MRETNPKPTQKSCPPPPNRVCKILQLDHGGAGAITCQICKHYPRIRNAKMGIPPFRPKWSRRDLGSKPGPRQQAVVSQGPVLHPKINYGSSYNVTVYLSGIITIIVYESLQKDQFIKEFFNKRKTKNVVEFSKKCPLKF